MSTISAFPFDKDSLDVRDARGIYPFNLQASTIGRSRPVYAVVAMGAANEIGARGNMPWHLPEDLRHFKQLTLGHPVVMGRTTWLSIPRRPLPGRRNIVLSRNPGFNPEGAEACSSLSDAIALCPPPEIPVIIGGGSIYREALPMISKIYVTRIDAFFPEADTFFPELSPADWILTDKSDTMTSASGLNFHYETYESRNNQ